MLDCFHDCASCTHARLECMDACVLDANHPCGAVERARWIWSHEQLNCPVAQMERQHPGIHGRWETRRHQQKWKRGTADPVYIISNDSNFG